MPAWDDLRFALALHRGGNLSGAARRLRVDATTVGRRIKALEEAVGAPLFVRQRDGWVATATGLRLAEAAERAEGAVAEALRFAREESADPQGTVKLTTIESVATHLVAPRLPALARRHPGITLDIVCTPRVLDLARGEADLAVRIGRPTEPTMMARRLASVQERAHATPTFLDAHGLKAHELTRADGLPFVITARPEEQRYVEALGGTIALRASHASTVIAAVAAGLGIGVLADVLVAGDPRFVHLPHLPHRDDLPIWLVAHPDVAQVARVRAVIDYLAEVSGR